MKTWYKKSQLIDHNDFISVDVRRLEGILEDHQRLSAIALKEMKEWLERGEEGIALEEAMERLSYYLSMMGIE